MNGNQTSRYFSYSPPTFDVWISQGPKGQPIPEDSIFHPDFVPDEIDDADENYFDD